MPTSTESPASPRFSLASTVSIALVLSALGGYYNELRYFVDCLENGHAPAIATPAQGVESVRTVLAEIKSATLRRTVRL